MVNGEWEMKEGMGLGLVVVGRGVEVGGEEGFEGEVLRGGREVDGRLEAELTADIGVGEVLVRPIARQLITKSVMRRDGTSATI